MSITERSRRRVYEALDRLESEYGEFEVVEKTWEQAPETYEFTVDRFEAGTLGGAGVWLTNGDGEVLLVRHEGEDEWSDPGGKHEPDESIEEAARREVWEETAVECELTGVRQAHVIEHRDEESARPPIVRLIAIFDGEYRSGTPTPEEGKISAVRWWDERPDRLLYGELGGFPIPAASGE